MGQVTKWVCDTCGKEASTGSMYPPEGWIPLNLPGGPQQWFCSPECLGGQAEKMKKERDNKKTAETLRGDVTPDKAPA